MAAISRVTGARLAAITRVRSEHMNPIKCALCALGNFSLAKEHVGSLATSTVVPFTTKASPVYVFPEDEDFAQLFEDKSLLFSDTTILVAKILAKTSSTFVEGVNPGKFISIQRPRRGGKTLCCEMLVEFLKPRTGSEKDKRKKFFESSELSESLFWNSEDCRDLFCSTPVIHLDFMGLKAIGDKDHLHSTIVEKIRILVKRSFEDVKKQGEVLGSVMTPELLAIYEKYTRSGVSESETGGSLGELIYFAKNFTDRSSVLLVDEIDTVYWSAAKSGHSAKTIKFMDIFLSSIKEHRAEIRKCVTFGILPFNSFGSESPLNVMKEYSLINGGCFEEDFFLTTEKVTALATKVFGSNRDRLTEAQKGMEERSSGYNGVTRSGKFGKPIYNPVSVTRYLSSVDFRELKGDFSRHGVDTSDLSIAKNYIENLSSKDQSIVLLFLTSYDEGKSLGPFDLSNPLDARDFVLSSSHADAPIEKLLKYLVYTGFLTITQDTTEAFSALEGVAGGSSDDTGSRSSRVDLEKAYLKIPNKEVLGAFFQMYRESMRKPKMITQVRLMQSIEAFLKGDPGFFLSFVMNEIKQNSSCYTLNKEANYHNIFTVHLSLCIECIEGRLHSNKETTMGARPDIIIERADEVIVIELKHSKKVAGLSAALKEAEAQMEVKKYEQAFSKGKSTVRRISFAVSSTTYAWIQKTYKPKEGEVFEDESELSDPVDILKS